MFRHRLGGDRDQLPIHWGQARGDYGRLRPVASEVNPLISVFRENGIQVTALHSHMLNDERRLFFMHFWANDDAVKLARGLKAALDQTNSKR